jgi:predicted SnoaL-like aldol condensation-catalyzing enzyme
MSDLSPTPVTTGRKVSPQEARNRDAALEFFNLLINGGERREEALALLGPTYRQHNPGVADGIEGIRQMLPALSAEFPGVRADIKRAFVDGDFVILHSHVRMTEEDRGSAVMDIFRLEEGRVVEHWDVVQPIPAESRNENGMF